MATPRYLLASQGQYSWGDEATPYSKAADPTTYFGYTLGEVEFPNPNPYSPMATGGGRRGPHALAPDAKEYGFEVEYAVIDKNVPWHNALGAQADTLKDPDVTPSSGDEYTETLFTEADYLPPITVEHAQKDENGPLMQEWFTGCKSNLQLSAQQGEVVRARQAFVGTLKTYEDASPAYPDLAIPENVHPFKFWMAGQIDIDRSSGGADVTDIATINGFDCSWDNGLESNQHGQGREPYSVSEETGAELYDFTLDVVVTDLDLYKEAIDDGDLVDVTIPIHRPPGQANLRDALIIHLYDCRIVDAPLPFANEGKVEATIAVQPTSTDIEIRTPA